MLSRFPHIAEQFIDKLNNKNLVKCRSFSRYWKTFVDYEKVPFRFIRLFTNKSDVELRKIVAKTNSKNQRIKVPQCI